MTDDFSLLDDFFLQIESEHRPTHWGLVFDLDPHADPIGIDTLEQRMRDRVADYSVFLYGAKGAGRSRPRLHRYDVDAAVSCLSSVRVGSESDWVELIGRTLAQPLTRDRPSWRLVLVDQAEPRRQRLVLLVHHAMSDGIAGAGYAGLFIDGNAAGLRQLERFLTAERFDPRAATGKRTLPAALGNLGSIWARAVTSGRLPRLTAGKRRSVEVLDIPTSRVRELAARYSGGTADVLIATIAEATAKALPDSAPAVLRAFLPATLDPALRHTGNAVSMVLVNAKTETADVSVTVADISRQLAKIGATGAPDALPAVSRMAAALPWTAQCVAARTTMATMAPDMHIGVNPAFVKLRTAFGAEVTAVHPLSPLLGNPVSFTCLVLGGTVHIGVVWDPGAVGGSFGAVAVERLRATYELDNSNFQRDSDLQSAVRGGEG